MTFPPRVFSTARRAGIRAATVILAALVCTYLRRKQWRQRCHLAGVLGGVQTV